MDEPLAEAQALIRSGRLDEATEHLTNVVEHDPANLTARQLLAGVLAERGKLTQAIAQLEAAAQLAPASKEISANLATLRAAREYARGLALMQADRPRDAEACYRAALGHKPDFLDALAGLCPLLVASGRLDEAEARCRRAVELSPGLAETHYNLAIALARQRKFDEALASHARALERKPDDPEMHVGYALTLLVLGRLTEGWREFAWRTRRPGGEDARITQPLWRGEPLDGRTILLRSDQGHGDALQFIRYVPLIRAKGGRIIVECQQALVRLLSAYPGVDWAVARGQPVPPFDVYAPMMNLAGMLGTTLENIPADVPYLAADPAMSAAWKERLSTDAGLRVGICWQGSPTHAEDKQRSIQLSQFAELAMPGIRLYSLQVGPGREQLGAFAGRFPLSDPITQVSDFSDMAALVDSLDLVITCDSAPAHLAGALGVPVWVALPYASDWRWLVDREDSPWYPTMRLFRQPHPGNWSHVFQRMRAALEALVARRSID